MLDIKQKAIQTSVYSLLSNFLLALIKAFGGIFGNSFALIADAIESTSDIFSSFFVYFGLKYAHRPPDENHPYGHGRAETLITFLVVAFLIVSATIIGFESVLNIMTPHELPEKWTLYVLAGIIIWKELSYRYVIHQSKLTGSSALKADAWHHRSDAITSVAAFIGISIALYAGKGYEAADDWAALFASFFILYHAYKILSPALREVMDENIYPELKDDIHRFSKGFPGIIATEKCFIRKSGIQYNIDLHVIVDGTISVKEGHFKAHQLVDFLKLKLPEIGQILVHIEPDQMDFEES